MSNILDATGLTVKTLTEITTTLVGGMQTIYGSDINVESDTPDGQNINIFAQAAVDNLNALAVVYNSFSPDSAFGVTLSQRFALNGMTRLGATYTIQPVSVTADRALSLVGLDGGTTPTGSEFVVYDENGNRFILVDSYDFVAAGTTSLSFRAANAGAVQTTVNTITNIETVTLGITAVNNSAGVTTQGVDEESDLDFRIRQGKSFFLAAAGPADAISAWLLQNVVGVTDAYVEENATGLPFADGLPAHSIWAIVIGGANADIATAIYKKKAMGCGTYGSVSNSVARANSQTATINFDRQTDQSLAVKFGLVAKNAVDSFDKPTTKTALVAALPYKIAQQATIGDVVVAMETIAPNGYLTGCQVSKDGGATWHDVVATDNVAHRFVLTTANITIS